MHGTIADLELLIIFLLFVISLVTWIGNQLPVPYTVGLVLAGLILTFVPTFTVELPELISELILALFLPPIVFEAAYQLNTRQLQLNAWLIAMLTTAGVILSTGIVAVFISTVTPEISLLVAAVFGALISAIDPVAVIALFKESQVSHRLETLVEGESLLNDGTAIVIFGIVLAAVQGSGELSIGEGVISFLRVSLGGLLIGGIIGYVVARILYYIDDVVVEMTLTTCLALGSFLIAEQFHVSGVLAVVTAGLMHGHMGFSNMSEHTQNTVIMIWEYLAYVANAFIFLIIGLTSDIDEILSHLPIIGLAIIAVIVSRAITVYFLIPVYTRILPWQLPIPRAWQHILFWGGQRGAVSLALVLSLPHDFPERESIVLMTFGVVLFTSLVQATSMPWLVYQLGSGVMDVEEKEEIPTPSEPI